jgi:tRNA (adenine57-N1/adenine58-N1)-methyltransferase
MCSENDVVLLRKKSTKNITLPFLSKPLQHQKQVAITGGRKDSIQHSDIIGKRWRDVVRTKKGEEYRVHEPTLSEYSRFTPRLVTPVSLSIVYQ